MTLITTSKQRWVRVGLTTMVAMVLGAAPAPAQTKEELADKLQKANNRIRDLEGKVEALLGRMEQLEKAPGEQAKVRAKMQRLLGKMNEKTQHDPVWKSRYKDLILELYGYIKVDAAYTTARTNDVDKTLFVRPEGPGTTNDDESGITANQTRLGLKVHSPYPAFGADVMGLVEVDFFGVGPENKSGLKMRKAYVEMVWPDDELKLLAGQTFEPLSPLNPDMLNYPVLWFAGNMGYRRPMLMVTKGLPLGEEARLVLQGAVLRSTSLGGDTVRLGPGINEADDAGWPLVEGRVGLVLPAWVADQTVTLGVSGHYGEDEVDAIPGDGGGLHFPSWSVVSDFSVPVTEWLKVKGEVFVGDNLDTFFGGIGQGIDLPLATEVHAVGGWGQLTVYPGVLLAVKKGAKDVWLNFGYGVDDPRNSDLSVGRRARNEALFGNIMWRLTPQLTIGAEVSYWETDYIDANDGESVRFQTSVIYAF